MNKKPSDATPPSGFRPTLLKSSALFRAVGHIYRAMKLAALVTAIAALGSGVHVINLRAKDQLSQLTSKWRWLFFGSAFIAGLMVIFSLKFYFSLREIASERRRRGIRLFIITCVVMAILELAVGGVAFTDSRSAEILGDTDEPRRHVEWVSFVIVYSLCLLLVVLEIVSIIIAIACVRTQHYEQIATVSVLKDVVEFERRPSSVGGVEDMEFSIEKIDDGAGRADDAEKQPLRRNGETNGSSNATETMLVNNELYGVPPTMVKRPKQIPPPLPPVKQEETNTDAPPPLPSSPIPDENDHPVSPRSPTFTRYERQSRGSTTGKNPNFPKYEDTVFTHYNPQLGSFHRPYISPGESAQSTEHQEAS